MDPPGPGLRPRHPDVRPKSSTGIVQLLLSQTMTALLPTSNTFGKGDADTAFAGTAPGSPEELVQVDAQLFSPRGSCSACRLIDMADYECNSLDEMVFNIDKRVPGRPSASVELVGFRTTPQKVK
ncbi:hypothetical protein DL764_010126 [Monosporascus ibericus]|uniref:Uncharacterized protein n=1 Tax=Monosporascus ibericus TaxID=155417 RepID=A0A4Q4SV52_9PEZI|nr:hypothetical protein DL764_010126 [Monosporascus ibericus]